MLFRFISVRFMLFVAPWVDDDGDGDAGFGGLAERQRSVGFAGVVACVRDSFSAPFSQAKMREAR
jgi:hypothetical protein